MQNDTDKITYKLKRTPKRNKREKESDSSRESLEMELESFNNKNMTKKKTADGEEIKFFFNLPPEKSKKTKPAICTSKTMPRFSLNLPFNENNELNFKDILVNYINSPELKAKKNKFKEDKRRSVIYERPNVVLTLNGES